jgi:hypothetical protein
LKQKAELNMQRFKITQEIDLIEEEEEGKRGVSKGDAKRVSLVIKEHFHTSKNFMSALKKNQIAVFAFIKQLILH